MFYFEIIPFNNDWGKLQIKFLSGDQSDQLQEPSQKGCKYQILVLFQFC